MTKNSAAKLRDLSNEQLLRQLRADVYRGASQAVSDALEMLLQCGWDPGTLLNEGILPALRSADTDFRDGLLFVPEILRTVAARGL